MQPLHGAARDAEAYNEITELSESQDTTASSETQPAGAQREDPSKSRPGEALPATTSTYVPADITDVPPDVLSMIFSDLVSGHRLDMRCISRKWFNWVDNVLVGATHINIVLDTQKLTLALQRQHLPPDNDPCATASQVATCTPRFSLSRAPATAPAGASHGVLAQRFPRARAARLWLGCRPTPALAGLNAEGITATDAPSDASILTRKLSYTRVRQTVRQAASKSIGKAAACLIQSGRAVQDFVTDAVNDCIWACLRGLGRLRRRPQPGRLRQARPPDPLVVSLKWHIHQQQDRGQNSVAVIKRYALGPPDPALEPLPACLPLLGASTCLTRLSLVTAFDISAEDLQRLVAAFPNLTALGIHAHQAPFVDPVPVGLPSLEPLLPPQQPAVVVRRESAQAAQDTAKPRSTAGSSTADTALTITSGGNGSAPSGPSASSSSNSNPAGPSTPFAARLPSQALNPPPQEQMLPLQAGPPPQLLRPLHTLVLAGVRCEWPEASGLQHLTGLRALVLHRIEGRMHRLVPQIEVLTQLTRLELRRLDYHRCLPLDEEDLRLLQLKVARVQRRKVRLEEALRAMVEPGEGFLGAPLVLPFGSDSSGSGRTARTLRSGAQHQQGSDGSSSSCSDGSDNEGRREGRGGKRETARVPWLRPKQYQKVVNTGCDASPDWPYTMRMLGRAVRGMSAMRVLCCDVECPVDDKSGAWSNLLSGVRRLPGLEELRLPCLVFENAEQLTSLAAALPELRTLELGTLPPCEPSAHNPRSHRGRCRNHARETSRLNFLKRYYLDPPLTRGVPPAAAATAVGELESHVVAGAASGASAGVFYGDGASSGGAVGASDRPVGPTCRCPQCEMRAGRLVEDPYEYDRYVAALRSTTPPPSVGPRPEGPESEDGEQRASRSSPQGVRCGPGGCAHWQWQQEHLHGGLGAFRELRNLILRRSSVSSLAEWLPLPPRLLRLEAPLVHDVGLQGAYMPIIQLDLDLLHASLLPALASVPELHLSLGQAGASGPLLVAMLAAWLRYNVVALDLWEATHPFRVSEEEAVNCLRIAADGFPKLRRLACCLWSSGTHGPMFPGHQQPPSGLSSAQSVTSPTPPAGSASASPGDTGLAAAAAADGAPAASFGGRTAVECLNALPHLQELRVKVRTKVGAATQCSSLHNTRAPLGLLTALRRPIRVVDCAPQDVWYSQDGSVELPQARAAAAAAGARSILVAEAEEWAAGAMGLDPDSDAHWRQDSGLAM